MSNNAMSYNGAISNRDGVVPGREKVRCGPIQTVIQQPHQVCKMCKLRVSSWNVGTMHGRTSEVVETSGRSCIQNLKRKKNSVRILYLFIYYFVLFTKGMHSCSS